MRFITWLFRAVLFFVLFAFAMNNQHEAQLKWFFGYEWRAPMVFIVLAVFAAGAALGLLGHLPGWWRRWRVQRSGVADGAGSPAAVEDRRAAATGKAPVTPPASEPEALPEPPRDVL